MCIYASFNTLHPRPALARGRNKARPLHKVRLVIALIVSRFGHSQYERALKKGFFLSATERNSGGKRWKSTKILFEAYLGNHTKAIRSPLFKTKGGKSHLELRGSLTKETAAIHRSCPHTCGDSFNGGWVFAPNELSTRQTRRNAIE